MTNSKRRGKAFTAGVLIASVALGFLLVAAIMRGFGGRDAGTGGGADPARTSAEQQPAAQDGREAAEPVREAAQAGRESGPAAAARPTPGAAAEGVSPLEQMFGGGEPLPQSPRGDNADWLMTLATAAVRLTLAALLSAMLAYRPRRFSGTLRRNPYVGQTQILMAVVASALMMVVGDSAARAFGIFAAASLVRFRTNIKDPKEITVLLVSLAIGLATGVGRWELGLVLTLFVLLLLWGLEYREHDLVTRAMELTVKTRNIGTTQDALLQLFRRYNFTSEMRTIDRPDGEGESGCVVYHVSLSQQASTDRISEELLAADPRNIDSVEWSQQKNTSYFYQ